MNQDMLDEKNLLVMKLLHYFITEMNYNPIILQGAENEIWLENLNGDYRIVRIVSGYIHNKEQMNFDVFKTKRIAKKIKKKTFSFNMNVLSIYLDKGENAELVNSKNLTSISLNSENELKKNNTLLEIFPTIADKLKFSEEGFQLFIKITNDINKKNQNDAQKVEDVFKEKKPIVTNILITLNVLIFVVMLLSGYFDLFLNIFCVYAPFIRAGQYYRLLTGAFLHLDVFHLIFNMYALKIIGSQVESYMGKVKFLIIYLLSALTGSLMSMIFSGSASVGASGAIFGLMGSLVYFGYHYRVYLGTVLRSQIIPLILFNLMLGFLPGSGIDNAAHIGGLIGGALVTMGVGVKYKSTTFEKTNGLIIFSIFLIFLVYMAFVYAI